MMQGFYLLTLRRQRRRKRIVALACLAAFGSVIAAAHTSNATTPAMAEETILLPYIAIADGDRLIVTRGEETVIRTAIDIRSLPSADRTALEKGIELEDAAALAKLLEDYGS